MLCRAFAASDSQMLQGTGLPLSLVLAFWFRIRAGDMSALSIKVKYLSGSSAPLWRSCWAKFGCKTPVSTTSKIEVCDFVNLRAWYVYKTNFRVRKCLLWKIISCLSPSWVSQFGTCVFVKVNRLGTPAL